MYTIINLYRFPLDLSSGWKFFFFSLTFAPMDFHNLKWKTSSSAEVEIWKHFSSNIIGLNPMIQYLLFPRDWASHVLPWFKSCSVSRNLSYIFSSGFELFDPIASLNQNLFDTIASVNQNLFDPILSVNQTPSYKKWQDQD